MDTFQNILVEIGRALLPLKNALISEENFYSFVLDLGWETESIPQPLQSLSSRLDILFLELQAILGDGISLDGSLTIQPDSVSGSGVHPSFYSPEIDK
ncbi:hypothetical protein [Nostoc sp. 106C]|uniref:hypothetical protein n=1 Tax=Nostoc sp. 106C TaxID=1932667 RepID=UPI000A38BE2F|nr:hypothetical protein [Nostoc sp. 106C]OUL32312.1 hypothetical protein BV375_09650 [Nostoc sp. 106C]